MIENNRWYSNVERASAPCQTRERGLSYFCQLIKVDFEIYSRSTYKNKKSHVMYKFGSNKLGSVYG